MKFGIVPVQEGQRYQETLLQAVTAEELGYDSVWAVEHHGVDEGYWPSPLLILAGIATRTSRVQLGTAVLVLPLYDPVRVAEEAACLDVMSGGRLILGVSAGYREEEFQAFRIPVATRGKRLQEGMAILRELWARTDGSFPGEIFPLDRVTIYPRPMQPGGPPIWVGGWADAAVRRAALHGDAWLPGPTADLATLCRCRGVYAATRAGAGLPEHTGEVPLMREVFVATDRRLLAEAERCLDRMYAHDYKRWAHKTVPVGEYEELRRDRFLVGDPDTVCREIERYRAELGVTHLIMRMAFNQLATEVVLASMRTFAREVMPHFR